MKNLEEWLKRFINWCNDVLSSFGVEENDGLML